MAPNQVETTDLDLINPYDLFDRISTANERGSSIDVICGGEQGDIWDNIDYRIEFGILEKLEIFDGDDQIQIPEDSEVQIYVDGESMYLGLVKEFGEIYLSESIYWVPNHDTIQVSESGGKLKVKGYMIAPGGSRPEYYVFKDFDFNTGRLLEVTINTQVKRGEFSAHKFYLRGDNTHDFHNSAVFYEGGEASGGGAGTLPEPLRVTEGMMQKEFAFYKSLLSRNN